MDYEKKYNEALDKARTYYRGLANCRAKDELENIFSELRESEDERIIRAIIDALYSHTNSINLLSSRGYQMEDIEAYLEKQKKPENTSASTMVPSCWAEEPSLQKEPKPAEWSEEDENVYESIQTILLAEARFVEERKWFDSIKARIRSVCWSKEDAQGIEAPFIALQNLTNEKI